MNIERTAPWITALGLVALAAGGAAYAFSVRRQRLQHDLPSEIVDGGPVDNVSHEDGRAGSSSDRGRKPAFALDIDQLRSKPDFEPAVEYLTFIQSKRGTDSHLLFVRFEDLDAIAALEGDSVPNFLERLDHLGVVVSNN